jgi:hypothetical protein
MYKGETFIKVNDKWKYLCDLDPSDKVTDVDGKWNMLTFCSCGNELNHSGSFFMTTTVKHNTVYTYRCSYCDEISYYNPDIIPGLCPCNENGIPWPVLDEV